MTFDLRRALRLLLVCGLLFVALLGALSLTAGVSEVAAHLSRLGPWVVPGLLALSLVNYGLRAWRWHLLGRRVGVELPFGRHLLYYVAGFSLTMTPGKLGEVIRLWLLRRHHGYAYERTAGLVLLDRITDALPMLALVLLGAASFSQYTAALTVVALLVVAPGLLIFRPDLLESLLRQGWRLIGRGGRMMVRVLQTVRQLRAFASAPLLAATCGLGLIGWLAEISGLFWLLSELGYPISFPQAAFVFGFAMLVGALPFFPGGVGGAEATMVACLLALGIQLDVAVLATGITRLATLGFAVVIGLVALPFAIHTGRVSTTAPVFAPAAARTSRPVERPRVA